MKVPCTELFTTTIPVLRKKSPPDTQNQPTDGGLLQLYLAPRTAATVDTCFSRRSGPPTQGDRDVKPATVSLLACLLVYLFVCFLSMSSHLIARSLPPRTIFAPVLLSFCPLQQSSRPRLRRNSWRQVQNHRDCVTGLSRTRTVPRHRPRTTVLGKWHQHGWHWNSRRFGQQLSRTSPFRFFCSIFVWMPLHRGRLATPMGRLCSNNRGVGAPWEAGVFSPVQYITFAVSSSSRDESASQCFLSCDFLFVLTLFFDLPVHCTTPTFVSLLSLLLLSLINFSHSFWIR